MIVIHADITIFSLNSSGPREHIFKIRDHCNRIKTGALVKKHKQLDYLKISTLPALVLTHVSQTLVKSNIHT